MQTLTAGSFLNLENQGNVEALKFTACRLAEHTAAVAAAENLPPSALTNLSNNLWEKAEYVARETERRRLHEIFTENFTERFRQLKPEIRRAENSISEVSSAALRSGNTTLPENAPTPEIIESDKNKFAVTEDAPPIAAAASPEYPTEAHGKEDEFLGYVESGEAFTESESENQPVAVEKSDSENLIVSGEINSPADNQDDKDSESAVAATAANNNPPPASQIKSTSPTTAVGQKEPFEFGKCTISLNLSLFPAESGKQTRRVIVSTASHDLPPEIELLEIADGEDLMQIAELVKDKLARFRQTLPVKYIEQLRTASKPKSAKKPVIVNTTVAAPTEAAVNQAKIEKPSGEQKSEPVNSSEVAKPETDVPASSSAFAPKVNKTVAANQIQGSLF